MGKVLIVIDMQNDFVTGTLGNKEAQAIVLNVQAKVKEYADRGDRIIFTRDTHGENYLDRLADCAWAGSGKLRIYRQADLWLA